MRNLKRALSLTLASVMLLGMMVVGSSAAAGYDDVKETDNVEAIEVLQTVGIMVGDERGFGPDRPVNRAEMAVVMGLLLNLDYNYYSATCPFNDVYDWARGWVGACAANGIVSGRGDGVYDPGATVTAVEAASMLMRALGYFKYASDYADGFEVSTVRQGTTIGIFKGVGSSAVEPMTRNQVAQMVLNTLRSGMVQPDGNTLNYFDNNGQVIATGGKINYVYVTSNDSFARSISRLEATSMGSPNGSPIVELGEQLYDGDLKLYGEGNSVADRVWDEFGRPARTWEYKGQEIGTYEKKELLKETYTAKVTGQTLYELLGKSTIDNYNFQIAIDGVYTNENNAVNTLRGAWFDEDDLYRNNKDAVGRTGNGVLTKVYVDTDFANPANYSVYIAIINTYLAKANEDYDSKNDDVSLRVWRLTNTSTATAPVYVKSNGDAPYTDYARTKDDFRDIDAKGEDFSIVKDVKKNDLYKVTVADGEIQTIEAPEILSAVTVDAFKLNDHVTTGGQQYDHATTARYDVEAIENWTGVAGELNLKELTYNVILDDYGYLLGLERNEDPNQYVFVTGIEATASNLYAKQLDANVIFLDGTMDTVKVDMTKSSWGQPGNADQALATNYTGNLSQLNTWCTYTVNNGGVYTLKRVAVSTTDNVVNTDPDDNIKVGQYAQDVALNGHNDGASEQNNGWDTKSINTKRVSLKSCSGNGFVYGNDDTVYLAVSLEAVRVDDTTNVSVYDKTTGTSAADALRNYRWIIDDVDTVVTGVKNASLKATDLGMAGNNSAGVTFGYPNAEIYTLYDEDGIVIAAVMIGEDDGASSTYAYIHSSGLEEESYASTGAARAEDGEWTWTRKAIVDGVETLLKEVGDSPKYLSPNPVGDWGGMNQGQWYEIRYNADGNVRRAISVPLTGTDLKYPVVVQNVETSVNDSETVVLRDVTTPTALSFSAGTLYTNTDLTKGFSVSPDVKTVLILAGKAGSGRNTQYNTKLFDSTTDGYTGYTGLEQALREVNYKATGITPIAGELEVSAIFNGGRATTIIINDYTPAPNNRPTTGGVDAPVVSVNAGIGGVAITGDDFSSVTDSNGHKTITVKAAPTSRVNLSALVSGVSGTVTYDWYNAYGIDSSDRTITVTAPAAGQQVRMTLTVTNTTTKGSASTAVTVIVEGKTEGGQQPTGNEQTLSLKGLLAPANDVKVWANGKAVNISEALRDQGDYKIPAGATVIIDLAADNSITTGKEVKLSNGTIVTLADGGAAWGDTITFKMPESAMTLDLSAADTISEGGASVAAVVKVTSHGGVTATFESTAKAADGTTPAVTATLAAGDTIYVPAGKLTLTSNGTGNKVVTALNVAGNASLGSNLYDATSGTAANKEVTVATANIDLWSANKVTVTGTGVTAKGKAVAANDAGAAATDSNGVYTPVGVELTVAGPSTPTFTGFVVTTDSTVKHSATSTTKFTMNDNKDVYVYGAYKVTLGTGITGVQSDSSQDIGTAAYVAGGKVTLTNSDTTNKGIVVYNANSFYSTAAAITGAQTVSADTEYRLYTKVTIGEAGTGKPTLALHVEDDSPAGHTQIAAATATAAATVYVESSDTRTFYVQSPTTGAGDKKLVVTGTDVERSANNSVGQGAYAYFKIGDTAVTVVEDDV